MIVRGDLTIEECKKGLAGLRSKYPDAAPIGMIEAKLKERGRG